MILPCIDVEMREMLLWYLHHLDQARLPSRGLPIPEEVVQMRGQPAFGVVEHPAKDEHDDAHEEEEERERGEVEHLLGGGLEQAQAVEHGVDNYLVGRPSSVVYRRYN